MLNVEDGEGRALMVVCSKCGQRNDDGDEFCRNASCAAYLPFAQDESKATGPAQPQQPTRSSPPRPPQKRGIKAALAQSEVVGTPGATASINLTIANSGTVVEQFETSVKGVPADWVTVQPEVVSLMPNAEATVAILFHPPRSFDTTPGPHTFFVSAVSTVSAEASASATGSIDVGTFEDVAVALTPQRTERARRAKHRVTLVNRGNTPATLTLDANDPDEALTFDFVQSQLTVEPGETRVVDVAVRPRHVHWLGKATPHPFTVIAKTGNDDQQPSGLLVQKPLLPVWAVPVAVVGVAALVAAVAFLGGHDKQAAGSNIARVEAPGSSDTTTTIGDTTTTTGGTTTTTGGTTTTTGGTTTTSTTVVLPPPPPTPPITVTPASGIAPGSTINATTAAFSLKNPDDGPDIVLEECPFSSMHQWPDNSPNDQSCIGLATIPVTGGSAKLTMYNPIGPKTCDDTHACSVWVIEVHNDPSGRYWYPLASADVTFAGASH